MDPTTTTQPFFSLPQNSNTQTTAAAHTTQLEIQIRGIQKEITHQRSLLGCKLTYFKERIFFKDVEYLFRRTLCNGKVVKELDEFIDFEALNSNGTPAYRGKTNKKSPDGIGTFVAEGYIYRGGFSRGQFQGKGTLIHANGDFYIGGFRDGRYEDKGILRFFPEGFLVQGNFSKNNYTGNGNVTLLDATYSSDEFILPEAPKSAHHLRLISINTLANQILYLRSQLPSTNTQSLSSRAVRH